MHSKIALLSLLLVLGLVNYSIAGKEKHLAEGQIVYLELAPVDPRSLMQGDYMALRFKIANDVRSALPRRPESRSWRPRYDATDGYAVVSLDERSVGTFIRLYKNEKLSVNQTLLRYRVRSGDVKFATNAFFFQEGHAKEYEQARYGQFRVDDSGELLLAAMFDKDLKKLGSDL